VVTAVLAATRAEMTKIRTLRGVWIFTGILLALQVLILLQTAGPTADAVANITPDGVIEIFADQPEPATRAILDLLIASSLQMGLFLPALGALVAGQEFRSRQLGITTLAVPRRGRLLVAKSLAVTVQMLVTALLIAALSTAATYHAVKDWNPGLLLTPDAFIGQAAFVVFAVSVALTGYALTVLARNTLAGIVASLGLLAVTMTQALAGVAPQVDALFLFSAARNLLLSPEMNQLTAGPMHGLLVLLSWAVLSTLVAGIAHSRRDVR
jgi:hypothetical protein